MQCDKVAGVQINNCKVYGVSCDMSESRKNVVLITVVCGQSDVSKHI